MRTGYFHPQQQPELVGQVINARVDPGDVNPHQVAAQFLHCPHVPPHFLVGGRAGLIQDAVEIDGFVVEVNVTSPRFDLTQSETGFYLGGVAV